MDYLVTFLEGIMSFISPCILPMIPVYLIYFAGEKEESSGGRKTWRTFINSLGFVLGFTILFVATGLAAGVVGRFLARHGRIVDIVAGIFVIVFGLIYMGVIKLPGMSRMAPSKVNGINFIKAIIFGMGVAIAWTPCIGPLLGSALLLAASKDTAVTGALLLLCYSLGLGIPLILCTFLMDLLKNLFNAIKKHFRMIQIICGIFLVIMGILMITGIYSSIMLSLTR